MGQEMDAGHTRTGEETTDLERRQLLSIFDAIDEPIYVSDPVTHELLYVNKAWQKDVGDVAGRKCYQALQGLDGPCPFCTNDSLFGKQAVQSYACQVQNLRTGRWYRCIDKAIIWPDGRKVRLEVAVDITERMRTEELLQEAHDELRKANKRMGRELEERLRVEKALAQSEALYRMAAANVHDSIFICGTDLRYSYVSPSHVRMMGYGIDETLGRSIFYTLMPTEKNRAEREIKDALKMQAEKGASIPLKIRKQKHLRKNEEIICVEVQCSFLFDDDNQFSGLMGVGRDITARMEAEEALARSEARLRDLIDRSVDVMFTMDRQGRFLEANEAFLKESGFEHSDVAGKRFHSLVHPSDTEIVEAAYKKGLAGKNHCFELRVKGKAGIYAWYSFSIRPIQGARGKAAAIHGIVRNISRRKASEEALLESQEMYFALFEASPDAMFLMDPESGKILDANPEAENLLGLSHKEILGMNQSLLYPPEFREQGEELFANVAANLEKSRPCSQEFTVSGPEGRVIPVIITARAFHAYGRPVILSYFRRSQG